MGQLMIFYSMVEDLDSVIRARLRDSTFDHTIFVKIEATGPTDIAELYDLCEKWSMPYAITTEYRDTLYAEIGRRPFEDEDGFGEPKSREDTDADDN